MFSVKGYLLLGLHGSISVRIFENKCHFRVFFRYIFTRFNFFN